MERKKIIAAAMALGIVAVLGGTASLVMKKNYLSKVFPSKQTPPAPVFQEDKYKYIYVYFKNIKSTSENAARLGKEYKVITIGKYTGYAKIAIPPGKTMEIMMAELKKNPEVKSVVAPAPVYPMFAPNDELYPLQWALHNTGTNPVTCPKVDGACSYNRSAPAAANDAGGCGCSSGVQTLPSCVPNDPQLHASQAKIDVNVEPAWDTTKGKDSNNQPVIVAVIDAFFNRSHPDLQQSLWIRQGEETACAADYSTINHDSIDCFGRNFVDASEGLKIEATPGDPTTSHGSFCAGIIAANINNGSNGKMGVSGVAPESKVMLLRVETITDAAEAIQFAIANGAKVISSSVSYHPCFVPGDGDKRPASKDSIPIFREALKNAKDAGLAFVQAAGNNGRERQWCNPSAPVQTCDFDLSAAPANEIPFPVNLAPEFSNMVVVAALARDGTRPPFSHFGTRFVHVFAPGAYVMGLGFNAEKPTEGNWTSSSGTSFAAPHVAGAVALVAAHKGISGVDAIAHLKATVNSTAVVTPGDVQWGGMIDTAAALNHP